MHVLVERWPALLRIPRIPLVAAPTPVAPLVRTSEKVDAEVWVKRDDLTAPRYGGNKVRKLEYLLGQARERGVLMEDVRGETRLDVFGEGSSYSVDGAI